jgi:hypothetical protein
VNSGIMAPKVSGSVRPTATSMDCIARVSQSAAT